MIDVILLIGRLLFVALLYLFLFALMKTGIGLVKGQRAKEKSWYVTVERGPKELRGVRMAVRGPVIVGRAPGADIVIGTAVNGRPITNPVALRDGDTVNVGDVAMRARFE